MKNIHIEIENLNFSLKRLLSATLFTLIWSTACCQVTGIVFKDYNGDGLKQGGEPGVQGIEIKAYINATFPNTDSLVAQTISIDDGSYTISAPTYPVRLEFEIPGGLCNVSNTTDFPSMNLTPDVNSTEVQVADDGEVHNFGIIYPYDFSVEENPRSFISRFMNGDPLAPGVNGDVEALVTFPYLTTGIQNFDVVATQKQIGTCYGLAYSRQAEKVFSSAFLRRHTGLGPLGGGGIYIMDANPPYNTTADLSFIDFDELGIPTSDESSPYTSNPVCNLGMSSDSVVMWSPVIGSNTDRGLPASFAQPSWDRAAYSQVGTLSFGDMDISEDGRFLYVVNLYDRRLYEIDLQDPENPTPIVANEVIFGPPGAPGFDQYGNSPQSRIKRYDIPDPCVTFENGEYRPFALRVYKGKVYVGVTCLGTDICGNRVANDVSDLTGNVFEFDLNSHSFNPTPLISFDYSYRNGMTGPDGRPLDWFTLTNKWIVRQPLPHFEHGIPLIADIEFDNVGNMLVSHMDVYSSIVGWDNYPIMSETNLYRAFSAGDLVQVKIEPNAGCSYLAQLSPEYYEDNSSNGHFENSRGGLSVHHTSELDLVLNSALSPVRSSSGGTELFDNVTGTHYQSGHEIYSGVTQGGLGKANGLGDIETVAATPPIEIGNMIWLDEDADGIQDPEESGIAGVTVELVNSSGVVISTTVTDNLGTYYFNHTNVNSGSGPEPNTDYTIRISGFQYANGVGMGPLSMMRLTASDEVGNGFLDWSDNDAREIGGLARIDLTTGDIGENNHSYDFGFQPNEPLIVHQKTVTNVDQVAANTWEVTYELEVENIGTGSGSYRLVDVPDFDDDFIILNAFYFSDAPGNPGGFLIGSGPWELANSQDINVGITHTYILVVEAVVDLEDTNIGDGQYNPCESQTPGIPQGGEALFNRSWLDANDDGIPEVADTVCADVPYIAHQKRHVSTNRTAIGQYSVVFEVQVDNLGGAYGEYNLNDIPGFDNDFETLSAEYVTDAIGNPGNPGPVFLAGSGPWSLANDQGINPGESQTYTITVDVHIDLQDAASAGDEVYNYCGTTTPGTPQSGEGLFNQTTLDVNDDNMPDRRDSACVDVEIVDLALRKRTEPGPYLYGENVTFNISIYNQGNVTLSEIEVTDYIPPGFVFNGGDNPDWTGAYPEVRTTIPGPLTPGDSMTTSITLELTMTQGGERDWINYAEITGMTDDSGQDRTLDDEDSMAGSDGVAERGVYPGDDADNDILSRDKGGDEDDHDPAEVEIFDLALIKVPAAAGPFSYGQSVPFEITVVNQGNIPATDIVVYDYVQPGFEFDVANNFPLGWTYFGDPVNIAQRTIADVNPLNPGEELTITIWLTVVPADAELAEAWTNRAEIQSAKDPDGQPQDDIDSQPDGSEDNDAGGEPNTSTDDQLDGSGIVDEDDADPALIEIVDLALRKRVGTPGPYSYGQPVIFEITVYNQGNVTSRNTEVTDYIPAGYGFNPLLNPGWAGAQPNVTTIIPGDLSPGDSATVIITLVVNMTTGGQKDWINYSEVTNITDTTGTNRNLDEADSTPGSNGPDENEVEPWDPEDDDITSMDKGGEEDDHDPAGIEIQDLAVFMLDDTDILADYGDDVTFPIMVFNQGSVVNDGFTLTNYIPDGYTFNGADNPGWVVVNDSTVTYTYPDDFGPGEQVDLEIVLETQSAKGEYGWTNVIEISDDNPVSLLGNNGLVDIDSDPDQTRTNDPGGAVETASDDVVNGDGKNGGGAPLDEDPTTDEDDQDPEVIRVFDLALKKQLLTSEPYFYGQDHEFEICIVNQGNEPMTQVEITDHIPEGYTFNAGLSAGWSQTDDSTVTYVIDRVEDCDTVCVSLWMTLEMTDGGTRNWINYAEITEMQDTNGVVRDDVDSNPNSDGPEERAVEPGDPADDDTDSNDKGGEEDDHDPAGPDIYDLALIKTSQDLGPFEYGDIITFDVWVYNQGNLPATEVEVSEYIPVGYEWQAANNGNWSWDAVNRIATLTSKMASIAPGDSAMVQFDLEILQSYEVGAWDNYAEITSTDDPVEDIDSTPNNNPEDDQGGEPNTPDDDEKDEDGKNNPNDDEDDHDPHRPKIVDLALNKRVPNKEPFYIPGDTVPFKITVYNQGNEPVANTLIKDYMPQGFLFDNTIPENAGWSDNAGTLEYTYGPVLDSQDSVMIDLYLIVQIAANPTLDDWRNYAEIGVIRDTLDNDISDQEADSYPSSDADHERDVMDNDDGDERDDVVTGDYRSDPTEDEDDHDPEEVEVTGALGDFVWKDLDGDGIQDPGEPGVEGVIVTLYECDGTFVRMDTTDDTGFYFFDFLLPLREYYAVFDISPLNNPDCVFTFANEGDDDEIDSDINAAGVGPCTYIEPGERDSTYDAGLVELASVGDFVWHDRDADGIQEGGDEVGIPDVDVRLYDKDGILIGETQTDANGFYLFDDLMPMEYYIEFEYMDMWRRTPSNVGGDDGIDSDVDDSNGPNTTQLIDLDPGDNDVTWDLGLYKCIPVGDFVWYDVNFDGVQDFPENGINGVRVYLYDGADNLIDQTITGPDPQSASADGYWKFCVDPGTYYVVFERPGHLAASDAQQGGDNEKDSDITHTVTMYSTYYFTVRSGDMRCDIDGGFHSKATMGDHVWYDENQNGLQEANEQSVQGVVVSAYDSNDQMFWQDVSDRDGQFYMDGLSTGEYYLKFDPPAGYTFTYPDAGDEAIDSDVSGANGPRTTALYRVNPGQHQPDVDGGLVTGFLPTELLSFDAKLQGEKVAVTWRTAVEINNDYFEVERRHESEKSFRVIGIVQAAGTTYTAQDYKLDDYDIDQEGVYYYRLRQVDTDDTDARSEVRTIEIFGTAAKLSIYPNPTTDVLNVVLSTPVDGEVRIEVQDKLGRSLTAYTAEFEAEKGRTTRQLEIESLSSGVYSLKVYMNGEVHDLRFTKI